MVFLGVVDRVLWNLNDQVLLGEDGLREEAQWGVQVLGDLQWRDDEGTVAWFGSLGSLIRGLGFNLPPQHAQVPMDSFQGEATTFTGSLMIR